LRFDGGVVHGVVVCYLYCLRFDRGVVHGAVVLYIVNYYSCRFSTGVVLYVVNY
jgi:hypothetical protein